MTEATRYEVAVFINGRPVKVLDTTVRKSRAAMIALASDHQITLAAMANELDKSADMTWNAELCRLVWDTLSFGLTGATKFQRENEAK